MNIREESWPLISERVRKSEGANFHFAGLSNRAKNCLKRAGIQFSWELREKSDKELLQEVGIGPSLIKEIRILFVSEKA